MNDLSIQKGLNPVFILVGVTIGLIILAVFGGMTLLGATNSANLASATDVLSQTLPIVGIGVFVGIIVVAMKFGGGK